MSTGKDIIKNKNVVQHLSEHVSGIPSDSFLLITLNDCKLSIVADENQTPEGVWALTRFAMVEIKNSINPKKEVIGG